MLVDSAILSLIKFEIWCLHFISGFTFTEVSSVRASASKVICCHFSSDGKLLASGGHDKKVSAKRIKVSYIIKSEC